MTDETAKSVTETVVSKSKGKVSLVFEEYEDLVRKAARPVVNNVTVNRLTNQQVAKQNVIYGSLLLGVGVVLSIGGALIRQNGKANLK